jgi:hypothetical protein
MIAKGRSDAKAERLKTMKEKFAKFYNTEIKNLIAKKASHEQRVSEVINRGKSRA